MSQGHDLFWADFFGVKVSTWAEQGTSVVPHVGLSGYQGVWFFQRGGRSIVSAPSPWVSRIRSDLGRVGEPQGLPSEPDLRKLFGEHLERCIGPAFHGSIDAAAFRPASSENVRALTNEDAAAVRDFRAACSEDDWQDADFDQNERHRAAYFDNGAITAMAAFRPWSASAGDPCVLTHPAHRGSGRGKRVVSHVLSAVFAEGLVPLYQTLESNLGAVRLALSLGYRPYASHMAIRLTSPEP